MNKHRLRLLDKSDLRMTKNNVDNCVLHLSIAEKYLSEHLRGQNKNGLITNISNARYEIKRFFNKTIK